MRREYIFAFMYDDTDCLFRDIVFHDGEGFAYLPSHKVFNGRVATFLERACLSYQLNSRFEVPLQSVFYNLDGYPYKDDTNYVLVIPNSAIAKFTTRYLLAFKRRHGNVRLCALLVDSIHGHSIQMGLVRDKLHPDIWDEVLTYDSHDAKEFGYTWIGFAYYSSHDDAEPSPVVSDLFCVGSDKGRDGTYARMYDALSRRGVRCNFRIFTHSKDRFLPGTDLEYMRKFMPYDDVVGEVKSSNCILEILQPDQRVQTIRYFEAVAYNKKLLTNNHEIEGLPFYDPRYMRVFDRAGDVDVDWVRRREDIRYQYGGEFSPLRLLDLLRKSER